MKNWMPTISITDSELGCMIFGINTIWDFKVRPVTPRNGIRFEMLEDAIAFVSVLKKNNLQAENVTFSYVELGEFDGLQSCYDENPKKSKTIADYYMLDNCPEVYHTIHNNCAYPWCKSETLKRAIANERKLIEEKKQLKMDRIARNQRIANSATPPVKPMDWSVAVVHNRAQ